MKSVCVTCPSCGAQLDVDLKTKSAICEFCNRKVVLTADDLASSEVVENNIQLAKGAFFDRDMKNAEIHARTILGYDAHNIVANFLLAYIREFYIKVKTSSPIREFFDEADLSDASDGEIMTVMQFVAAQPVYYISDIISIENFVARVDDIRMASAFMDRFLYAAVSSSKTSTWFPGGIDAMRDFYTGALTKYHLGKAYLGLYESLRKFEDSPLVSGYKFITRARLFYRDYVTAVCLSVAAMPDCPAKAKLIAACENTKELIKDGIERREHDIEHIDNMVYSIETGQFISEDDAAADEEGAEQDAEAYGDEYAEAECYDEEGACDDTEDNL